MDSSGYRIEEMAIIPTKKWLDLLSSSLKDKDRRIFTMLTDIEWGVDETALSCNIDPVTMKLSITFINKVHTMDNCVSTMGNVV